MSHDARGWRVALVPEVLVNVRDSPGEMCGDALLTIETNGYGLLQLPPSGKHVLLLAVIADQVAEYAHHGYAVVAIGVAGEEGAGLHWRRLAPLLRHRGIAPPPRHLVRPAADRAIEKNVSVPSSRATIYRSMNSGVGGCDTPVPAQ